MKIEVPACLAGYVRGHTRIASRILLLRCSDPQLSASLYHVMPNISLYRYVLLEPLDGGVGYAHRWTVEGDVTPLHHLGVPLNVVVVNVWGNCQRQVMVSLVAKIVLWIMNVLIHHM